MRHSIPRNCCYDSLAGKNNLNTEDYRKTGPEVINVFSCSTELIIIKISRHSTFLGSDKPKMLFFRNCSTNCWRLNIYEQEKFKLS